MIRPVVGSPLLVTSVHDIPVKNKSLLNIWPNPASDYINIDPGDLQLSQSSFITITDLNGHELIRVLFNNKVDISSLKDGMYFLVININGSPNGYNRFIKSR
jgi:hypothetical protein